MRHTRPVAAMGLAAAMTLFLVAQLPGGGGAEAASRKVAIGVGIYDGRDLSDLEAFRASIGGRRVAAWTIWRGWDPATTGRFPTAAATGARERGATPVIWWEPYWCCEARDAQFTPPQVLQGQYDGYIREFAQDAKAFGTTILLRYAHQANSEYLPWAWDYLPSDANTMDTFIAAWRHVHRIFDEVGASNVKWIWTVATQTCAGDGKQVAFTVSNCMSRPLGYPGNAWVDYMGFTWENWGAAPSGSVIPSGPWTPMIDGFRPIVNRLKQVSDKPIVATAIASAPDGGNRSSWIRNGYQAVYEKLPRVVAIVWLNVDLSGPPVHHRDWSLRGASLDAYADIAAMPKFQGGID